MGAAADTDLDREAPHGGRRRLVHLRRHEEAWSRLDVSVASSGPDGGDDVRAPLCRTRPAPNAAPMEHGGQRLRVGGEAQGFRRLWNWRRDACAHTLGVARSSRSVAASRRPRLVARSIGAAGEPLSSRAAVGVAAAHCRARAAVAWRRLPRASASSATAWRVGRQPPVHLERRRRSAHPKQRVSSGRSQQRQRPVAWGGSRPSRPAATRPRVASAGRGR